MSSVNSFRPVTHSVLLKCTKLTTIEQVVLIPPNVADYKQKAVILLLYKVP